jgi:aryl-alcohol dehydrogenase-like predicted oxidoreductase
MDMKVLVDNGFTTFDLADHYGPAEDYVGDFRDRFGNIPGVTFFTKWVPQRLVFG